MLLGTIPFLVDATVTQKSPNTLTAIVDRGDPVQVSFCGVPEWKRLRGGDTIKENGLRIASICDLAGTKAAVVQRRAEALCYFEDGTVHNLSTEIRERLVSAVKGVDLAHLPLPGQLPAGSDKGRSQ